MDEKKEIEHNLGVLRESLGRDMEIVRKYLSQDIPQTGSIHSNGILLKMHNTCEVCHNLVRKLSTLNMLREGNEGDTK